MPSIVVKKDPDVHLKQHFYYYLWSQVRNAASVPGKRLKSLADPMTREENYAISGILLSKQRLLEKHHEHSRYLRLMRKSKQL